MEAPDIVLRAIEVLEKLQSRQAAVEKSLDALQREHSRLASDVGEIKAYIAKVAQIEEKREKREELSSAQRAEAVREVWKSPWAQLAIGALVVGMLNWLGLSWAVQQIHGGSAP